MVVKIPKKIPSGRGPYLSNSHPEKKAMKAHRTMLAEKITEEAVLVISNSASNELRKTP